MMCKAWLTMFVLISAVTLPGPLAMATLARRILETKQPQALDTTVRDDSAGETRRRACRMERLLSRPPLHCYSKTLGRDAIQELDRECVARTRVAVNLHLAAAELLELSARCRDAVTERVSDLQYASGGNASR